MLRLAALLASLHVASSDDHSCAAGLTMDVYANGASTDPVRVELDGGHCGTMAAFEAAVSRAACGDPAACHVRDGAGRRVRKCSQLSRSSADFGVQPPGVARAYGVRRDMRFVFATERIGFVRYLPHLGNMTLTTLAERPRLFALDGFMSGDDADQLVADALAIDDDTALPADLRARLPPASISLAETFPSPSVSSDARKPTLFFSGSLFSSSVALASSKEARLARSTARASLALSSSAFVANLGLAMASTRAWSSSSFVLYLMTGILATGWRSHCRAAL